MSQNPRGRALVSRYILDKGFYDRLRAARPTFRLVEQFIVPPYGGRGFTVRKGQAFRFTDVEGPQIGDVALWNADDPRREYFRPSHSMSVEGMFINLYTRLWSDVPMFRPMATCIEDTVRTASPEKGWHNHFPGSHCTPEIREMSTGRAGLNACHLNFLQAVEPFGLTEPDIHDNFMVFQRLRIDPVRGVRIFGKTDAKKGDIIEFFAEINLLVALSVCPSGDGKRVKDPDKLVVRPIGVEIYDTGIEPKESPRWADWRPTWRGRWVPPPPLSAAPASR
ncbi:MAG: urea carboxylase-associated family protein [Chloroflexi bacterium]|nr:urea carboxylase-associated family protein [Chloroflexota bacterium]